MGSSTWTVCGWAQETKARCGVPAKTTSAGSFNVLIVPTTRSVARSTMLTESEIKLTTQISESVRKRTDTGSKPTLTLPRAAGFPALTSNNSSRLSGKLHTASFVLSGLRATGCTGGLSQLQNEVEFVWPAKK